MAAEAAAPPAAAPASPRRALLDDSANWLPALRPVTGTCSAWTSVLARRAVSPPRAGSPSHATLNAAALAVGQLVAAGASPPRRRQQSSPLISRGTAAGGDPEGAAPTPAAALAAPSRQPQKSMSEGALLPVPKRGERRPVQIAAAALLSGMSPGTQAQNQRNARELEVMLSPARKELSPSSVALVGSPTFRRLSSADGSPQFGQTARMTEALEEMVGAIADARARHDAFEPGKDHGATAKGGKSRRRTYSSMSSEEARERFEAYKMVRKIEPELPPLAPSHEDFAPRTLQQTIVKRNASGGSVKMWSPQLRQMRIQAMNAELHDRIEAVNLQRDRQVERDSRRYEAELLRKHMQGLRAELARRPGQVSKVDLSRKFQEQWLSVVAVTQFITNVKQKLEYNKMDFKDRMNYDLRVKGKSEIASVDPQDAKQLQLCKYLSCCFRLKLKVRRARTNANIVATSLKKWRDGGATVLSKLRFFLAKVVRLQRWWLRAAKRLREQRDKISQRWVQLERVMLQTATGGSSARRRGRASSKQGGGGGGTPLPDGLRLRFIEHELRARRYFLLPWIQRWEEDRKGLQDASEANANSCVAVFKSCTSCPSYMPPAHPSSEARGSPCPENCQGRKGDAEILDMVLRAHTSRGRGWRKLPSKGEGMGPRERTLSGDNNDKTQEEEARPFGTPADDAELRRWGVDTQAMVYLSAGEDVNTGDQQVHALLSTI
eukprot:TRINITY_DN13083_c0_g1_i1.p1 TRINITY_DN13083_c0_g1~~TRINITY_DN13083_c0_g1_i1.p1  ORF type:complete len:720 (-),score=156.80 TRINITY_DN13083_c0_g1_i1:102-2261(-)